MGECTLAGREERGLRFEEFTARLFDRLGAEILGRSAERNIPYDLRIRSHKTGVEALVEVKLYESLRIANNIVRQSYHRLNGAMAKVNVMHGIFITNAKLQLSLRQEGRANGIAVYDFDRISYLVALFPDMSPEWEQLSQEIFIYRSEPLPEPSGVYEPEFDEFFQLPDPPSATRLARHAEFSGTDLCRRLKASKSGPGKAATEFEQLCVDVLKYLFDEDFIKWNPQKKSHSRLHRFDLIVRISSQVDFWNSIITDHRSRYVIFEFKNHGNPITPTEIYTTERYLLPSALRSTAIIISRKGVSNSAYRAMAGALRKSAKLILSLNLEQLCEMLHLKENGDDPVSVIADQLDAMLTGMER
jgi:hypothetical protein